MQYWIGDDGNNTKSAPWHQQGRQWTMYGQGGDDQLKSGMANDYLYGGAGNDRLEGLWGDDELYGEDGNDNLDGSDGDDFVDGGTGNDELRGGWGRDQLYGSDGNDNLNGNDGEDFLVGGTGSDALVGGWRDDRLIGVDPNSTNPGFGEIDTLTGGGLGGELSDWSIDTFVLGDSNHAYYQGGNSTDYAIIDGFESVDLLVLKGNSSDYTVRENNLFYNNDLIAVFHNIIPSDSNNVSLAVSSAIFV